MRLVILESPYAASKAIKEQSLLLASEVVSFHIRYAEAALRHSVLIMGEAPMASHLLYTRALDDTDPEERKYGMEAGLEWRRKAEASVVYRDLGISPGMEYGIKLCREQGLPVEMRSLQMWHGIDWEQEYKTLLQSMA